MPLLVLPDFVFTWQSLSSTGCLPNSRSIKRCTDLSLRQTNVDVLVALRSIDYCSVETLGLNSHGDCEESDNAEDDVKGLFDYGYTEVDLSGLV